MKRWHAWVAAAAALLAPELALAGDGPAHTAAMLKAAYAVKSSSFPHGVGAPKVGEALTDGKFQIDLGGFDGSSAGLVYDAGRCWLCATPDDEKMCAERCNFGAAVNAPDTWNCTDPKQPPALTNLNTQDSPLQVQALPTLGRVIPAAMACNYNHFASNAAIGMNANQAFMLTNDWAYQIPKSISEKGGTTEFSCNPETFATYEGRVANSLHYVQDAQSEHHAIGNAICNTDMEILPPLIAVGVLADLQSPCVDWLRETFGSDLPALCDDEVVNSAVSKVTGAADVTWLTTNVAGLRAACYGGSPLACMGIERLLRHHCDLDGSKSIKCRGKSDDHFDETSDAAYCEGERFPGGGQDFIALASSASEQPFKDAMQAWADVCQEPNDPCKATECDTWCHRLSPQKPGYCVSDKPEADCTRHRCICEEKCGTPGAPCCTTGDACTSNSAVCNGATGLCEVGSTPPNDCSPDGSLTMPGVNGDGGPGDGDAGAGGEGGQGNLEAGTGASGGADSSGGAAAVGPAKVHFPSHTVGDPHLLTFDGLLYDIQAVGELTLVKDSTDGLEVQVRTHPYNGSKSVAVNVAVAARIGSDRFAIYPGAETTLNGASHVFAAHSYTALPGGGSVYRVGADFDLVWPDGSQVWISRPSGDWFRVDLYAPDSRAGRLSGLLGNFDGSSDQDLLTRDGVVLPSPADFATFYNVYAESWRIAQADSLFDYGTNETTETYTNRSFPYLRLRASDLDMTAYAAGLAACQTSDITDPRWLDACILDVGATGDPSFALAYGTLPVPRAKLDIDAPLVQDAVNQGGLPFSGSGVTGTITHGSKDSYSFTASAGAGIQVRMVDVNSGALAPKITIYGPSGSAVATYVAADVAYGSFAAATAGTYTVVVTDNAGTGSGAYRLNFAEAPGSNKDGLLSNGGMAAGVIERGELDSYTFTANAGEGVQLRMTDTAGGVFAPAMEIYTPSGGAQTFVYGADVAYSSFQAPVTGTYTVIAYDWSTAAAGSGSYNLYYAKAPGANKGGLLSNGDAITGRIEEGELDSYTFTANAGEGVQLRMTDLGGGVFAPAMEIYTPSGGAETFVYGADVAYASFQAPATGTYTVIAYDWSTAAAGSGNYNLYYAKAPGANKGGLLSNGDAITGRIEEGELDSYTFSANAGEGIQLRMTDLGGSVFAPAMEIYTPSGSPETFVYGADVAYTSFQAPASGTYTVIAYDWSTAAAGSGNYNLYYAKAPGANKGGLLSNGGATTGTIEEGELDSYTFSANAGEGIQLRMTDLGGGVFAPAMEIYTPSGSPETFVYGADVAYTSFQAPTSGTYTVIAYDWSAAAAGSGDYKIYYTKAPGANAGGALTSGVPVAGMLDKGELDSYTFTAAVGQTAQLSITDTSGGPFAPAMEIYDPTGAAVKFVYSDTSAVTSFAVAKSGTYTVVCYDWSAAAVSTGNYQVLLQLTP
jgi:hypothetical protein